jgi:hypothetical protein
MGFDDLREPSTLLEWSWGRIALGETSTFSSKTYSEMAINFLCYLHMLLGEYFSS